MYCKHCAAEIDNDVIICTKCGKQVAEIKGSEPQSIIINNTANASAMTSSNGIGNAKNKTTSIILCCLGFFGLAGMHKLYEGKPVIAIVYFFTFGLFFIGTILDLLALLSKPKLYYV